MGSAEVRKQASGINHQPNPVQFAYLKALLSTDIRTQLQIYIEEHDKVEETDISFTEGLIIAKEMMQDMSYCSNV